MSPRKSSAELASNTAPRYLVPDRVAMTVEHPCIVKNVEKGVEMIGGSSAIAQSLKAGLEAPLNLHFHPDDPASRPAVSIPKTAKNILLQVTVPTRTVRKRKRGSSDPFIEDLKGQPPAKGTQYLLQSMRDNPNSYTIEPIAAISSTHVWRSMPDFIYSTAQSDFLNEIREKLLPKSYPLMKQYQFPKTYGLTNTEVIPPPQLSSHAIPTNYSYRANPQIQAQIDPITGQQTLYGGKEARKNHTPSIQWYSAIPTAPSPFLPALSTQSQTYQSVVVTLREIFSRRHIWTRRALINQLPANTSLQTARFALAHVAFNFRSGPWRDTVCALGVDPRSDPKYRIYQSIMIQLVRKQGRADGSDNDSDEDTTWDASRTWKRSEDPTSHVFTGEGEVPPDGKIWQACDIVDPQLASIINLDESVVEQKCEIRTRGFYPAGAWAKLKVALKYKIEAMQKDLIEEYANAIDNFLMLPDVWNGAETGAAVGQIVGGYLPADLRGPEVHWSTIWRSHVRVMLLNEEKMAEGKEKGADGDDVARAAAGDRGHGTVEAGTGIGSEDTPEIIYTPEVPDDDGATFSEEDEDRCVDSEGDGQQDAEDEDLNLSDDDMQE